MLTATQTTLDKINKSYSYSMVPGCWLEYNMNEIIDGSTVNNYDGSNQVSNTYKREVDGVKYEPFVKLFPITSIIDPRRPKVAGIKYKILNPNVAEPDIEYKSSANLPYRLYFAGQKIQYKYWVSPPGGACNIKVVYPEAKTSQINKVVVKFETSHSKPTAWTIKITKLDGTQETISTNATVPDNGVVNVFYNGSAWSTTEFTTPGAPVGIKEIAVQVTSISNSNEYTGVIEVSGRYVLDISDRITSYRISKTSSDSSDGIVPVGNVTSNSLSLDINSYDRLVRAYDKTFTFDKTKVNLYKNIKVTPFYNIESEKINQGVFYIESFNIGEYGDVNINAMDGAKFLQEIIAPDILTTDLPSQAIIRRLLDSIGFTNYNFTTSSTDTSTIKPYYWYTDDTKSVWDHIQDLCKDTQMIATFDENDILQFYTREYLFDKTKAVSQTFRYAANGDLLPNIMSFSKEDVASVKAVKVIYTPQISGSYGASSDPLYQAPLITLAASALTKTLTADAGAGGSIFLEPVLTYDKVTDSVTTNKTGYFLINDEIIEYDAVKYHYNEKGTETVTEVWITNDSDVSKHLGLSTPNTLKPTGEYRIKARNVFGALAAPKEHKVDLDAIRNAWTTKVLDTVAKTTSTNEDKVTLISTNSSGNKVPRSMLNVTAAEDNLKYTITTHNGKFLSSTSENYVIGTSMYFPLVIDPTTNRATGNQKTIGGIAFSLNSDCTSGYILKIGTTQNVTKADNYRDVQLYKMSGGVLTPLTDNQKKPEDSITGIRGGELYKVDIKISKTVPAGITGQLLTFKIMFNNEIIYASDNSPLELTEKVGLLGIEGTSSYDFVYTSSISADEFTKNETYNLYQGFLSGNSTLVKNFGDFVLTKSTATENPSWLEEFGPVARELKKITTKYATRPGIPAYPLITLNPFATIVGFSQDSFGAEIFVLNSSGAFLALSDNDQKGLSVIGQSVMSQDPFEYLDPEFSSTQNQEQLAFESVWIQKEQEAKTLSDWMKKQWSKQQSVVSMDVFPNPLIQIGDIVEISYPDNNIYATGDSGTVSKFIVLDVTQSWQEADPGTSIVCRSIYID